MNVPAAGGPYFSVPGKGRAEMSLKRRQLLIDRPVQVGLVGRLVVQWFTFLAAVVVVLPMFRAIVLVDAATPLSERIRSAGVDAAILLVLFLAFLPYFIYDTFKITNRFAGPMYRLQQTFKSIAGGAPFRPIKFRKGDFWHDAAGDFNRMAAKLQEGATPHADEADTERDTVNEPVAV